MLSLSSFYRLALILSCLSLAWTSSNPTSGTFMIQPDSQLRLEGSTSLGSYECICQEEFGKDTFTLDPKSRAPEFHFRSTDIKLSTRQLDCGNNKMNRDLQKALQADHFPSIRIELLSFRIPEGQVQLPLCQWSVIQAKSRITIAGTSRLVPLYVDVFPIDERSYRLRSEADLKMTDFCIEPPRPMLGMIKVHDAICVQFDLTTHWQWQ